MKLFKFINNIVTNEQRLHYINEGYIVFRNLFKKKEVNLLDESIIYFADEDWHNIMNPDRIEFLLSQSHKIFQSIKSQNEKIKFVKKAIQTSSKFRSYLIDPRIKKIIESLVGKEVVGLMTHIIFKHKKSRFSKMSWVPHQDNSYACMPKNCYITANLFIHEAFKENGCLFLYPGSHKHGLFKFKSYFSYHAKSKHNPGNRILKKLKEDNKIDLVVKPGDFLIMNGNLVHGSYPNISKKFSRHLLSFNYGVAGKKFVPGITAQRKAIRFS